MGYRKTFISSLVIFLSLMLSACHFGSSNDEPELDVVELLISLSFDVRNSSLDTIPKGYSQTLVAIATLRDGSVVDLSEEVTWHSSDTDVLVTNGNRITGANVGSASIYVTYGELTSNSVVLDISDAVLASIQLTPASVTLPLGLKQTYQALATFSDATVRDISNDVSWTISDSSIATLDGGELTSLQTGSAELTASSEGVNSNTVLFEITDVELVSIQVTPPVSEIAKGTVVTHVATGTYTDSNTFDISSIVSWESSNETVASVALGVATGDSSGSALISANLATISSNNATLTVTDATLETIQITPALSEIASGTTLTYTATGTYSDQTTQDLSESASWSSDNSSVATMNSNVATGEGIGTAEITASFGTKSSSVSLEVSDATLDSIQVTPARSEIANGNSEIYVATGTYSDKSTQDISDLVTWTSSDIDVATIITGVAESLLEGSATIDASLGAITSNRAMLEVTSATLASIQITPAVNTVAKGLNVTYAALGTYTDKSIQDISSSVAWSSSDVDVATIILGTAQSVLEGSTTIDASLDGITSNRVTLEITPATLDSIQITPAVSTIAKGNNVTYVALGTYTDDRTEDITDIVAWRSTNADVVSIINGVAESVAEGSVTITAISDERNSNNATLEVTSATLESIQVTSTVDEIAKGGDVTYIALGTYSDDSVEDISALVAWNSSDLDVATIINGIAVSVLEGSTTIRASLDSIDSNNATLEVSSATLESIQITSTVDEIAKGSDVTYIALGTYSDASVVDISALAAWNSSDLDVATIINGIAVSVFEGSTTIRASLDSIDSNDATLEVTSATLESIQITPLVSNIAKGLSVTYSALGTYSDDSAQDISDMVAWSSSDTGMATIINGLAESVEEGSIIIHAKLDGITSNDATLEVTSATLASIQIDTLSDIIVVTRSSTYTATGTYTDASTAGISSSVSWNSSEQSIATVAGGFVSAASQGVTNISVSQDDIDSPVLSIEVVDLIPECGTEPASGACINTTTGLSGDAAGKLFTSAPSLAAVTAMGYTVKGGISNTGTTYGDSYTEDGTYGPAGEFVRMLQVGATSPQSTRYCEDLNTVSFNSKTNWRQPSLDEFTDLNTDYPDGKLFSDQGWSLRWAYWTSTYYVTEKAFVVNFRNFNTVSFLVNTGRRPVSCVSNAD